MLITKFLDCNIEKKIIDIEKQYRIILPVQYKCFLYKYNGGYTLKTKFKVGNISSDLKGFYGLGDVQLSLEDIELSKWIQRNIFPIACDSFGNYIVIGLRKDVIGKIYFWEHDNGTKLEFLTEDLRDFIGKCKSEKINEAFPRSIKEREESLIAKGRGSIITDDLRKIWQAEIDNYERIIQEEVSID